MATIKGTNIGETRIGGTSSDLIYGYGGNDSLYGRAGNDQIWGGLGDDRLWGEDGSDILRGEDGRDSIWGGNCNDTIYGGIGNDNLYGDAGTDRIFGDAGDDTLKGGTGISDLRGGDGYDTIYYDPTTSDVRAVGNYLSGSYLEGDHVYVYNKATIDGAPARTVISYSGDPDEIGNGRIWFGSEDFEGVRIDVGTIEGTPNWISAVGAGGLSFHGERMGTYKVTGTSANDFMGGGEGSTFIGAAGDDTFYMDGYTTAISEPNDADLFDFEPIYDSGDANITGFNGAGAPGGDVIHFRSSADVTATETAGKTVFEVDANPDDDSDSGSVQKLTVDAVGLVQGTDWLLA